MNSKFTLFLNQKLPFASCPVSVELEPYRILCNDVQFPWEHSMRNPGPKLWVIGNEFGAMGAVWADCEQDALDELVNVGLAGGILLDKENQKPDDEATFAGNASEQIETEHLWMSTVVFDKVRDFDLILKFAEARSAGAENLDK